jgi:hypothetical protein
MTETNTANQDNLTEAASGKRRPNAHDNSVAYLEEKLRKARLKLAQAKVEQAKQAERGKRIREQSIGRILLELIEEERIDASFFALLRDEVKKSCRRDSQVSAFAGTVFE